MPEFKRRKVNIEEKKDDNYCSSIQQQQPLFSVDIISEISKYIDNITDYFNLALINKDIFNLIMKENLYSLNELFKRKEIKIIKEIPNYLYNNLHYLNIDNSNDINSLQNCIKLKSLSVNCCNINDNVLQNMVDLEEIGLYNCKDITGVYFNNFTKLKSLELKLINIYDKYLMNLQNLNKLSLVNCKYINGLFFKNLKQLTTLHINNCNNIDKHNFSYLINLKELHILDENNVNCNFLQYFFNLEYLEMYCNEFKDDDFKNLSNLKTLILFGSSNNFIGNCFVVLKKLETINIESSISNLETKNLNYLTNLYSLKYFEPLKIKYLNNLTKLQYLNAPLYDNFKKNYNLQFPNVTELNVFTNNYNSFLGKCLIFFPNLKKLNIPYTRAKEKYLFNLTSIVELNIAQCYNIDFGEFLLTLNNLQYLICNDHLSFKNEDLILLKLLIKDKLLKINEPELKKIFEIISKKINNKNIIEQKDNKIDQLEIDKKEMQRIIEEKEKEIKELKLLLNEQK
ncbi:hypothetical protein ABK040_015372 [Willaertia magna]